MSGKPKDEHVSNWDGDTFENSTSQATIKVKQPDRSNIDQTQLNFSRKPLHIRMKEYCEAINFFLAPNLKLPLYLGLDFIRSFNLIRFDIDSMTSHSDNSVDNSFPRMHELNVAQQKSLDSVINLFPCFTKRGLGKTSLEIHQIDTGDAVPIKYHT